MASQVIVQKSSREGFGLTVSEAMWKGQPVIGGNVGGIRIQIQDGMSGFLVDSSEECSHRLVQLIRDPELRDRMGQAARERVRQHYLLPRLTLNYLQAAKAHSGKLAVQSGTSGDGFGGFEYLDTLRL